MLFYSHILRLGALLLLAGAALCGQAVWSAEEISDSAPAFSGTPGAAESPGGGQTLYVSTQGSDDTSGDTSGDQSAPFATLGGALQAAQPGDTIVIASGVYHESIETSAIGRAEAPIFIRGELNETVFDGQNELAFGLWCEDCTNLHVENLTFRNYTDIGVGFYHSSAITLRTLTVYDNGTAVQRKSWELEGYGFHIDESEGVLIENSVAYRNGPNPQRPPKYLMGTGINVYGCNHCIIRRNRSYENTGGGLLVEDSTDVLVESNDLYANDCDATADEWWDAGIWLDGGSDVTLRGNTVRDNIGPGIQVSNEDDQDPTGYLLEGNTVAGNTVGLYVWGFGAQDLPAETVLRLDNNDFSGNTQYETWIAADYCMPGDNCQSGAW
jgi:parallel beta-helix repeat protein